MLFKMREKHFLLILLGSLAACTQLTFYAPTPSGFVARGRELFRTSGIGAVPYACVDCHTDSPEEKDSPSLLPANSLYNTASRTSWYSGKFKTRAVQGAQYCLTERMQAAPLVGDDLEAMQSFLQSISPSRKIPPLAASQREAAQVLVAQEEIDAAARELGVEGPQAEGLARGRLLYVRACERCHEGSRKLGPPVKELAKPIEEFSKIVRIGKGSMPAFSIDRISTADLNMIAAYLSWAANAQ
jgi:mono/diheme cytochrome c family protein